MRACVARLALGDCSGQRLTAGEAIAALELTAVPRLHVLGTLAGLEAARPLVQLRVRGKQVLQAARVAVRRCRQAPLLQLGRELPGLDSNQQPSG